MFSLTCYKITFISIEILFTGLVLCAFMDTDIFIINTAAGIELFKLLYIPYRHLFEITGDIVFEVC